MRNPSQNTEFVRLWTLHGRRIYSYLLTMTSNRADADEIYQDVGMTLWEKFEQYESGTNFLAWARSVALNKVRNFRQLSRHKTRLCSPEFLDAVNNTVVRRTNMLDAQGQALEDCFERLPPRQRELIELRYQTGGSPESAAAQLGRSLSAVYKALGRIQSALLNCVRESTPGKEAS